MIFWGGGWNEPGSNVGPSANENAPRRRHRWHHLFSFTDYQPPAYSHLYSIRSAGPSNRRRRTLEGDLSRIKSLALSGIAFLWFMAVVRDRLGEREDRFFATVFFGSGLLFIGMTFVAAQAPEESSGSWRTDRKTS
jgi:hypothetical protein